MSVYKDKGCGPQQLGVPKSSFNKGKKKKGLKKACWKGYEAIGMKTKNGRKVPNCVPKKKK
tara:strand:- start:236 stop:418 length:183 start_codon:yes stop_codon:yes gene_type:complete